MASTTTIPSATTVNTPATTSCPKIEVKLVVVVDMVCLAEITGQYKTWHPAAEFKCLYCSVKKADLANFSIKEHALHDWSWFHEQAKFNGKSPVQVRSYDKDYY